MPYKIPHSVLVVIHSPDLQVLLLERADHPGFWQSVTGSLDHLDEVPSAAAQREVFEETGIDVTAHGLRDWHETNQYEIFAHWRHRYAPGVTHNTEHVFSVCVPVGTPIRLAPREHLQCIWLPWADAAERCFSWSNAQAIKKLGNGSL